jgi:hypothetical protein
MNINGILHFVINGKGDLRLFDTAQQATATKKETEVQAAITLTQQQMTTLLRAETIAKQKERDRAGRPEITTTGSAYEEYLRSNGLVNEPRD